MTNHPIMFYYYLVSKTLQAGKDSIHKPLINQISYLEINIWRKTMSSYGRMHFMSFFKICE